MSEISFALYVLFSQHVSYKLPYVFEYAEFFKNRIEINGTKYCFISLYEVYHKLKPYIHIYFEWVGDVIREPDATKGLHIKHSCPPISSGGGHDLNFNLLLRGRTRRVVFYPTYVQYIYVCTYF